MKKLKLYLAAVNAGAEAVGKKADEIKAIKAATWTATGLVTKQDYDVFEYLFNEAQAHAESLSHQLLPSELAAVPAA